jgi:hypothetical protein
MLAAGPMPLSVLTPGEPDLPHFFEEQANTSPRDVAG